MRINPGEGACDIQVYNRALTPDEIKATSTVQSTYTGTGTGTLATK